MPASGSQKAPPWAIPLLVITAVLVVVLATWRAMSGGAPPTADTAKEVRPGMYDFRAEAAKGSLGRKSTDQNAAPQ